MTKDELKDELKNEIKNRISLALKDYILQQGFECICNENADLKAYNEKLLNGDIEKHNKIVELKKACNETQELLNKQIEATYKVVEKLNEAKEIIKKFSEFANNEVEYDPEHPQDHTDLWNEL